MEYPDLEKEELQQQNVTLRVIIAELLLKNQNLRWELHREAQGAMVWSASEERPLRRNAFVAGRP
jgi:hypothetical protein